MWKHYHTVTTLDQALALLAEHGKQARIIAGGTDLMVEYMLGQRAGLATLIDINQIPGLDQIVLDEQGLIHIGPLVTHNAAVHSKLLRERARPLVQACWEVGAPQIRNRATIAGNIITASPANDTITPLLALDATVTLRSQARGERQVPLAAFYPAYRQTAMQPDELLTGITFPAMATGETGTFVKLALRQAQAISVIDLALVLKLLPGDPPTVEQARLAMGAVAATVIRAPDVETFLAGRQLTEAVIVEAAGLAAQVATPIDDVRSTASWRRHMVAVTLRQALADLRDNRPHGRLPDSPVMLWGPHRGRAPHPLTAPVTHHAAEDDTITLTVNGRQFSITGRSDKSLLRLLREDVGLTGTKEGCAEGECGACTVFLNGAAVMACMIPAPQAHNAQIVTIEGLATNGKLHPAQQAFIDEGAVQCGYCTPGLLMSSAKLLEEQPNPTTWEAQQAISGNLCRCTGYYKILNAVERARELNQASKEW